MKSNVDIEGLAVLCGDFYSVEVSAREVKVGLWAARGTIHRTDSNELVSGVGRNGDSSDRAKQKVFEALRMLLPKMPSPPKEWGQLGIRYALREYIEYRNYLSIHQNAILNLPAISEHSSEKMGTELRKFTEFVQQKVLVLVRKVNELSESDLASLMTSHDTAYLDCSDPWNLDDLEARAALFAFVMKPSKLVSKAHRLHVAKLKSP